MKINIPLKLGSSRKEIAESLYNKRVSKGLHKYQAARLIGISVGTLTKVEDAKSHSSITNYLVRQWVNKDGI